MEPQFDRARVMRALQERVMYRMLSYNRPYAQT